MQIFLTLVPQELILVMAPELQEDGLGTKDEIGYFTYQHEFISISCLSTGAARYPGHGTRIARGEGGTITISISLLSIFLSSSI